MEFNLSNLNVLQWLQYGVSECYFYTDVISTQLSIFGLDIVKSWKDVMKEYGEGKLHSGSKKGPKVKSQKQAVAIAFSEARKKARSDESKGMKASLKPKGMRVGKPKKRKM